MTLDASHPWRSPEWIAHTQVLLDSYRYWLGSDLIQRIGHEEQQAEQLFHAPFVVVSHGTGPDPVLNYGNLEALTLWEMPLEVLLRTPSRETAEPVHRDERAQLLERTSREGYVDDYQGVRITRSGRRFRIDQAIVWNLLDAGGSHVGQAATFSDWRFLDQPPAKPAAK